MSYTTVPISDVYVTLNALGVVQTCVAPIQKYRLEARRVPEIWKLRLEAVTVQLTGIAQTSKAWSALRTSLSTLAVSDRTFFEVTWLRRPGRTWHQQSDLFVTLLGHISGRR